MIVKPIITHPSEKYKAMLTHDSQSHHHATFETSILATSTHDSQAHHHATY